MLEVIESQTRYAKDNLADPDVSKSRLYRDKATRRARELPLVFDLLREQLSAVERGESLERFPTFTYRTAPSRRSSRSFRSARC